MKQILFPGATESLEQALIASEIALIGQYSEGMCLWIGAMDESRRELVEQLEVGFRIVRRPDEIMGESGRYDTIVLSPAFGEQLGPQVVQLLAELPLAEEGQLVLTGLTDVNRVIEQLGVGEITLEKIGPYGMLTRNSVLDQFLGGDSSYVSNHFGRLLTEPDAMSFWVWLEGYLHTILPPWLASRNMAVLRRGGSLQDSMSRWRAFDSCSHIDLTVLEHLLRGHFGEFHAGLQERMGALACADLVAKLSEVFERRMTRTVDFLSLITHEQRAEVTERLAWSWALDVHASLSHEDFYLDGVFVPQDVDFMMYREFMRVFIEAQELYP